MSALANEVIVERPPDSHPKRRLGVLEPIGKPAAPTRQRLAKGARHPHHGQPIRRNPVHPVGEKRGDHAPEDRGGQPRTLETVTERPQRRGRRPAERRKNPHGMLLNTVGIHHRTSLQHPVQVRA